MDNETCSRLEVSGYEPFPMHAVDDRAERNIAQTAREFGLTARALRFYESKRLLSPRRDGNARLYGPADRQRLASIVKAKALGFTLVEIRDMLGGAPTGDDGALSISRRQCHEQIKLLEQRKREIEAALAELRRTYSSFYVRLLGGSAAADAS